MPADSQYYSISNGSKYADGSPLPEEGAFDPMTTSVKQILPGYYSNREATRSDNMAYYPH